MGDGPPRFRRNFTCSAVLRIHSRENEVSTTGLLPSTTDLSRSLRLPRSFVTPYRMSYNPKRQASWFGLCSVSLAATQEIAFAFSSSRYLDVSVPWVCLPYPMYSDKDTIPLRMVGFPIRKSSDQSLLTAPRSISALVVLHRLLVSRHPPCALSNLTKLKIKKYELHCYLVFKEHTFIYER